MLKTTAAACLLVTALTLGPASAGAATTTADVRVVSNSGATLADQSQVTGDVTINTDPGADCFGPPGGSGNPVAITGPSALGIVKDASETNGALRPLSVTDQFSFGLGLCGIGGFSFNQGETAFWYLKVNHVGAQVSGETYILNSGDEVLWYLSPGFPPPGELELVAPKVVPAGQPFGVRVFSYSDGGQRSPVAGAFVTGSVQPSAADGTATVQLGDSATLQALRGTDIPSNREIVCVVTPKGGCGQAGSKTPRHKIIGTNGPDRIRGTELPDLIRARAGGDFINTRGGLSDKVNCGRGRDRAKVGANDVVRRCERVIRP
jgi:hypothetical protein